MLPLVCALLSCLLRTSLVLGNPRRQCQQQRGTAVQAGCARPQSMALLCWGPAHTPGRHLVPSAHPASPPTLLHRSLTPTP